MLIKVIILSLMTTAVHVSMMDGMIFSGLSAWLNRATSGRLIWMRKPLYECLTCMGGIWSVVFMFLFFDFSGFIPVVLSVIGLNTLIAKHIENEKN